MVLKVLITPKPFRLFSSEAPCPGGWGGARAGEVALCSEIPCPGGGDPVH